MCKSGRAPPLLLLSNSPIAHKPLTPLPGHKACPLHASLIVVPILSALPTTPQYSSVLPAPSHPRAWNALSPPSLGWLLPLNQISAQKLPPRGPLCPPNIKLYHPPLPEVIIQLIPLNIDTCQYWRSVFTLACITGLIHLPFPSRRWDIHEARDFTVLFTDTSSAPRGAYLLSIC